MTIGLASSESNRCHQKLENCLSDRSRWSVPSALDCTAARIGPRCPVEPLLHSPRYTPAGLPAETSRDETKQIAAAKKNAPNLRPTVEIIIIALLVEEEYKENRPDISFQIELRRPLCQRHRKLDF